MCEVFRELVVMLTSSVCCSLIVYVTDCLLLFSMFKSRTPFTKSSMFLLRMLISLSRQFLKRFTAIKPFPFASSSESASLILITMSN